MPIIILNITNWVRDYIKNFTFSDLMTLLTLISTWIFGYRVRKLVEIEKERMYMQNLKDILLNKLQELHTILYKDIPIVDTALISSLNEIISILGQVVKILQKGYRKKLDKIRKIKVEIGNTESSNGDLLKKKFIELDEIVCDFIQLLHKGV